MNLQPTDYLKVKNKGDKPIELKYDNMAVTVQPKKIGLATFDQVVNSFGHPWAAAGPTIFKASNGKDYHIPPREVEMQRLRVKYGAVIGQPADEFGRDELIPEAEIYDQDDNRVYTVLDDPSGMKYRPDVNQSSNTADEVKRLQRQLDMLTKSMKLAEQNAADDQGVTVPSDED